jgi:hypothetical protein
MRMALGVLLRHDPLVAASAIGPGQQDGFGEKMICVTIVQ